jgi:hypothetical protein
MRNFVKCAGHLAKLLELIEKTTMGGVGWENMRNVKRFWTEKLLTNVQFEDA